MAKGREFLPNQPKQLYEQNDSDPGQSMSPAAHSGKEYCSFRPRRDTLIISQNTVLVIKLK